MQPQMVMYDEEFQQISTVCERLAREANAKIVFLVDKNGQLIASVGATENLDTTSIASLTAGNIAATGGLAKLIGEKEFSILFHEGEKDNLHISIIGGRVILVVIFDTRSSLGLVRLRVKKASDELNKIFEGLMKKVQVPGAGSPFAEITDDDIDNLFTEQARRRRMSFINYSSREINCKIVYYGPGLCGKTTNLQYIYDKTNPNAKGKLISLATETDRTLFFDFLPLELGTVRGFTTRFHLYTVPGQVFYDASRKLILKGVDGVVFVADSQEERMDANIEALNNLEENLCAQGYDLMKIPYVLQLNKRDLPDVVPSGELKKLLLVKGEPTFEAVATQGVGVLDTLKAVARQVLVELRRGR